jgi:hypothetical protein
VTIKIKINVTDRLIADLRERERKGYETYGGPLETFNGRMPEQDALEEALDLTQYLYQARQERIQLEEELEFLREDNERLRNEVSHEYGRGYVDGIEDGLKR